MRGKLTYEEQLGTALDFIGMSESPDCCLSIDRQQLAEQMQNTLADSDDVEEIARLIEAEASER